MLNGYKPEPKGLDFLPEIFFSLQSRSERLADERASFTLLKAMGWTISASNPGKGKIFFSFAKSPHRLRGPPNLLFNGYRGSFARAQRLEREVDDSPPSSAEVKNEWSCTSTPPTISTLMAWAEATLFPGAISKR
jgi:hypothetical protein